MQEYYLILFKLVYYVERFPPFFLYIPLDYIFILRVSCKFKINLVEIYQKKGNLTHIQCAGDSKKIV